MTPILSHQQTMSHLTLGLTLLTFLTIRLSNYSQPNFVIFCVFLRSSYFARVYPNYKINKNIFKPTFKTCLGWIIFTNFLFFHVSRFVLLIGSAFTTWPVVIFSIFRSFIFKLDFRVSIISISFSSWTRFRLSTIDNSRSTSFFVIVQLMIDFIELGMHIP